MPWILLTEYEHFETNTWQSLFWAGERLHRALDFTHRTTKQSVYQASPGSHRQMGGTPTVAATRAWAGAVRAISSVSLSFRLELVMAEEFCLTCNQPDDGDRSLTRCPECGESWTTHKDRAMQHWIALALRLRWRSGGILIALVEPIWLRSIRALLVSLPSPPRRRRRWGWQTARRG